MAVIPSIVGDQIIDKIFTAYSAEEKSKNAKLYLGRLGSSSIGEECLRKIWFDWRGFDREEFEGRILRLFGTGHWQEDRVVEDLRRAGFNVWDKQENGNQYEYIDKTGHFITKLDGVIKNIPGNKTAHLLEIKTHNKNSFSALYKHGVAKSKPSHYSQVQISMKLQNIKSCVYVAVCKDDEKMYCEIIDSDKIEQEKLIKKINSLVKATITPAGISDNASSFGCKFCTFKAVCVKEKEPLKDCRTCRMCSPVKDGKWLCELNNYTLNLDEQRKGCKEHEFI